MADSQAILCSSDMVSVRGPCSMHALGVRAAPYGLRMRHAQHLAEPYAAVGLGVARVDLLGDGLPRRLQPLAPRTPGRVEVEHHCSPGQQQPRVRGTFVSNC